MAFMKRLLLIVPCIACLLMFAIGFTDKQQESLDEGKAESTKPIIHNMYVVCDPQDLCDFSPCRNGGTCHPTESDGTKSFVCHCTHGFGGKNCADTIPHIDLGKDPTFIEENTTVTLPRCHATGTPTPEFKWSKVGGSLPAQSEVEGGQLKIVNATKQDAGWYKCEATNSIGSDKSETNVEVIEFVKPPEVINATEGADKQVKCRVTAMLTQQTVKWSKSMRELPALSDGTLKLTNIRKRADAGTYTCTVLVGKLKFVAKFQLNILAQENCAKRYKSGFTTSGVFKIFPDENKPFYSFCDQTKGGGGWTVVQKRLDGSVDFFRNWADYRKGFGNLSGEFWLGLDKIHRLTSQTNNKLRVELEDFDGNTAYAEYDTFTVADEADMFRLRVWGYKGTAGDSLGYHDTKAFSTKDRDNDGNPHNCAIKYKGAWWYRDPCYESNLNAFYHGGNHSSFAGGVNWKTWRGFHYSAKRAEMKIRPVDF